MTELCITCSSCDNWHPVENHSIGHCWYGVVAQPYPGQALPMTFLSDWCGEWKPQVMETLP